MLFFALPIALATEHPEVGVYDRYRVEVPGWPGAEASSETGSVLLAPPDGVAWTVEEAPSLDDDPLPGDDVGTYDANEGIDALAARLGWLPSSPTFDRNPLEIAEQAEREGLDAGKAVGVEHLAQR